jgi:hypothetical protein
MLDTEKINKYKVKKNYGFCVHIGNKVYEDGEVFEAKESQIAGQEYKLDLPKPKKKATKKTAKKKTAKKKNS